MRRRRREGSGSGGGGGGGGTTFPIFAFVLSDNFDPSTAILNGSWNPATDPVASTITVFDIMGS